MRRAWERSDDETGPRDGARCQSGVTPRAECQRADKERTMSKWIGVTVVAGAVAVTALGCAQQPSATAAGVENRSYRVTPASVTVRAGIITGEVTEMKVTEMVEQGSDRVVSPAKLTGTLRLRNTSANQTVHLVGGKMKDAGV